MLLILFFFSQKGGGGLEMQPRLACTRAWNFIPAPPKPIIPSGDIGPTCKGTGECLCTHAAAQLAWSAPGAAVLICEGKRL